MSLRTDIKSPGNWSFCQILPNYWKSCKNRYLIVLPGPWTSTHQPPATQWTYTLTVTILQKNYYTISKVGNTALSGRSLWRPLRLLLMMGRLDPFCAQVSKSSSTTGNRLLNQRNWRSSFDGDSFASFRLRIWSIYFPLIGLRKYLPQLFYHKILILPICPNFIGRVYFEMGATFVQIAELSKLRLSVSQLSKSQFL